MKKIMKTLRKVNLKMKLVGVGIITAAFVVLVGWIITSNKESETTIISESTLKEILEIDELATLEYFYHSITKVTEEDSDKVKYHVTYKGTVRYGIEFEKIEISVDEANHRVNIVLPDIKLLDCNIDPEGYDFIFSKDKYETETIIIEAEAVCKEDLKTKASQNGNMKELAKESAIDGIRALILPWIEQVSDEYTVEIN